MADTADVTTTETDLLMGMIHTLIQQGMMEQKEQLDRIETYVSECQEMLAQIAGVFTQFSAMFPGGGLPPGIPEGLKLLGGR